MTPSILAGHISVTKAEPGFLGDGIRDPRRPGARVELDVDTSLAGC